MVEFPSSQCDKWVSFTAQYLWIHKFVIQLFFIGLEVRLFGMNTPNVGYLEVKYNGTWGVICMLSPQWTYRLAEVICRQLHLGPPLNDSFLSKKCPHSIQSTNTTWLTVINCQGFEASLDQCPLKVLGRIDDIDCGACQVCSVCLICQPQHASFTGISKSPLSLKFWPSSESWENQEINILNQVWQSNLL